MTPQSLIAECQKSGVLVRLDDGALKLRGAPDAVKDVAARMRPHKAELVEYLTGHTAHSHLNGENQSKAPTKNSKMAPKAIAKSLKADQQTIALLARFGLHECERDPEPELIARINNICYRLVHVSGWKFEEAMTAAAVWAVHNPAHPDEQHFTDVMALYRRRQYEGVLTTR